MVKFRQGEKVIALPIASNGRIALKSLKQYFPKADGVVYHRNGCTHGVVTDGDCLILDLDIEEYEIYCNDSPNQRATSSKESRIKDIIETLRKGDSKTTHTSTHSIPKHSASFQDKKGKSLAKKKTKERILRVGWLHQTSEGRYSQMKKPAAGIKELKLDPTIEYNVQDIIELAKTEFSNKSAQADMILKSTIKLGFFNGTVIENFETNGIPCDYWTYCRQNNFMSCRLILYLLTSFASINDGMPEKNIERDRSPISRTQDQYSIDSINMTGSYTSNNDRMPEMNLEQKKSIVSHSPDNPVDSLNMADSYSSDTNCIPEKNIERPKSTVSRSQDIYSVDGSLNMEGACSSALAASNQRQQKLNQINILYRGIKYSKYTGDLIITELDRAQVYMDAQQDNPDVLNISAEEYEPTDHGYEICKIILNNKILLEIEIDEYQKKVFTFPIMKGSSIPDHSLVHDVDELYGICDGKYGLGLISSCTDHCNPMFTWYKNGQVFKKGKFLYWIYTMDQLDDKANSWQCVVSCQGVKDQVEQSKNLSQAGKNSTLRSCTSVSNTNQLDKKTEITGTRHLPPHAPLHTRVNSFELKSDIISLPHINRTDFEISKTILGAGVQGKVFKGTWLGTAVAIKSINIINSNVKFILREIEVCNTIRHPNIIQVMSICLQVKTLYILMEFVDGNTLSDVLFDDDIKQEYALDDKKKHLICNQLCQAVNYLHLQKNPIIHRDIKPDNVMVTQQCIIKLCDLGLSTFKQMPTSLRSTSGNIPGHLKGTRLFMAPELMFQTSEATIYSDIWAVACTIVETYNETTVWNVVGEDPENILKNLLLQEAIPNLLGIPYKIRPFVEKCFSYDFRKRPLLIEIIKQYNSIL